MFMSAKTLIITTALLGQMAHAQLAQQVDGEFIVKLRDNRRVFSSASFIQIKKFTLGQDSYALVRTNTVTDETEALNALLQLSGVEAAEVNQLVTAALPAPSVNLIENNYFNVQWGLANLGVNEPDLRGQPNQEPGWIGADINAVAAWQVSRGSQQVKIAVLDTGVDYTHSELSSNIWTNTQEIAANGIDDDQNGFIDDVHGWNAVENNGDPMDQLGQGTHIAGIIGALHNETGVSGVMGEVSLVPVKIISNQGTLTIADALVGLDYAIRQNVDVIQFSGRFTQPSTALNSLIQLAAAKKIAVTMGAGDSGLNTDEASGYPSALGNRNLYIFTAMSHQDTLADFANFGRSSVFMAAPGQNIISTAPRNNFAVRSGSTMAAAHAAGTIGLYIAQSGRQTPFQLYSRLFATSVPGSSYELSVGSSSKLDAYNLLADIRPAHPVPPENNGVYYRLPSIIESAHPYANYSQIQHEIHIPGALGIRVIIKSMDIELRYDWLRLHDSNNVMVQSLEGVANNFVSNEVLGDRVKISFYSDSSQTKWGYRIEAVYVRYPEIEESKKQK